MLKIATAPLAFIIFTDSFRKYIQEIILKIHSEILSGILSGIPPKIAAEIYFSENLFGNFLSASCTPRKKSSPLVRRGTLCRALPGDLKTSKLE